MEHPEFSEEEIHRNRYEQIEHDFSKDYWRYQMSELEKLEFIYSLLQEIGSGYVDLEKIEEAIAMVVDMREPLLNRRKESEYE
tara:strand:- start:3633 stop:3881 length:249 start_codon:yes stop_codon:yes gene_type:complete